MKKNNMAALFLAGALMLTMTASGCARNVYAAEAEKGKIVVSGAGSVSIVPDVAYVSLGVNTQDTSPKTAQEKNNQLIASVIDTVKAQGIEDKDIVTSNFYMYPNYDYSTGRDKLTGYTVSNTVTVTVRDIAIVGDLLGAAADAGANVSNGVQFGLLDSSAAYSQALVLAIENAANKAQTIAGALGKAIGSPASVEESNGSYMPVMAKEMASYDRAAGSVPVQAGELTVTANVQVVYEYTR